MSLDNVVALAALTQGRVVLLVLGLLLSVPLLMYGSLFVTALLKRYPWLIRLGGAMLGWLAGDIAISDPLIADWVGQQSPALSFVVPWLLVVFVLVESRIVQEQLPVANALRPRPRPRPSIRPLRPPSLEAQPPIAVPAIAGGSGTVSAADTAPTPESLPEAAQEAAQEDSETRGKRPRFWLWIIIAASALLLWLLFHWLALDFASVSPPIQFTR